jgi:hypothetical protein
MSEALPEPFLAPDAVVTGPLITPAELATICQLPGQVIPEARLPFATMVIDLASDLIRDTAEHAEWTDATVPFRAKIICLLVAKRTYQNPNAVVAEGGVGPLGGDRVADIQAMGLYLTDVERADLEALRGDGTSASDPKRLWILRVNSGLPAIDTGYVFDDSGSDWAIPYIDFNTTDAMTDPSDTVVP